jgi:glycine cleavage system aminomethyltransferase T
MIPAVSLDTYTAARQRAGIVDRAERARIVVSGADRASFLQGLLTNDVVALKAGEGCYAAYLTAQGRMIADMDVYELGDVMLLTLHRDVKDTVMAKLDQVIFSEDVQLGDVTGTFAQMAVVGPLAASVVGKAFNVREVTLREMGEHGNLRAVWSGSPAIVTRASDMGVPGFDLFVEVDRSDALKRELSAAGAIEVDSATADAIRIESGVPLFHPRVAPGPRPGRAQVGGTAARGGSSASGGYFAPGRGSRRRPSDEQFVVARAAPADRAWLCPPRFHRAWREGDRGWRRGRGRRTAVCRAVGGTLKGFRSDV